MLSVQWQLADWLHFGVMDGQVEQVSKRNEDPFLQHPHKGVDFVFDLYSVGYLCAALHRSHAVSRGSWGIFERAPLERKWTRFHHGEGKDLLHWGAALLPPCNLPTHQSRKMGKLDDLEGFKMNVIELLHLNQNQLSCTVFLPPWT